MSVVECLLCGYEGTSHEAFSSECTDGTLARLADERTLSDELAAALEGALSHEEAWHTHQKQFTGSAAVLAKWRERRGS